MQLLRLRTIRQTQWTDNDIYPFAIQFHMIINMHEWLIYIYGVFLIKDWLKERTLTYRNELLENIQQLIYTKILSIKI